MIKLKQVLLSLNFVIISFKISWQRIALSKIGIIINLEVPSYKQQFHMHGHLKSIASIKFSTDGSLVASASADKTIRLWSSTDGKFEKSLKDHKLGINDCCWSYDNK